MSSGSRCLLAALACCLILGGCSVPDTTSTTTPQASLSPATLTFTSQNVGALSTSQTVTLSNAGTAALAITQIVASGDFAETNTCGSSVAAGASCAISVTFTPAAAGARTGSLAVTDNAAGSPHTASLAGTGVALAPHASLSPASLTFTSQATGSISAAQTVTLSNGGTAALSVTQIAATGDFAQTNNCGSSVAAGASCAIAVTFTPTATGTRSGTLTVTDNDSSSSQTASLSGTGATPVPQASLSPSTLTFSSQTMGTASSSQTVTLSNGGTGALTVARIAANGDFAETNNCGSSVVAGASCTISVTFTPSVAGTRSGSLTVTDNASSSLQTATLSGHGLAKVVAGCVETGTFSFPGCLSLSSPTQLVAGSTTGAARSALQNDAEAARAEGMETASGNFQSEFAAQTAQIAALLDGSDPAPATTLGTLGQAAISTNVGGMINSSENCFGPGLYYSHHPDAGMNVNPPINATDRIPPGDLGIWSQTDSSGKQACAAMEMNYLLSSAANKTQFGLALAAEIEYLAGTSFPATSGQTYDATAALTQVLNTSSVTLTYVTVSYDGTSYFYSSAFTVQMNGATINCTLKLKHSPGADSTTYSGVAQYGFDDGNNLVAGTTRYQRTSATHLDISARDTFYPSGAAPQLDSNGELDPGDPNVPGGNATFIYRFSRVGASFDPTSPLTTGSFLFVMQINAQATTGVGLPGLLNTFQLVLPGDGTGSAFYGYGDAAIDSPTVSQMTGTLTSGAALGTIDRIYCMRQSGISHLNAQFQALTYNSTDGQYEPSTTVASHARFAPTSTCQYSDAQWNNGAASGFWYDRKLQFATSMSQPTPPSPIPSYVVADPSDTNGHLFDLFGDNSTWPQTLINAGGSDWAGYTFPTLY